MSGLVGNDGLWWFNRGIVDWECQERSGK